MTLRALSDVSRVPLNDFLSWTFVVFLIIATCYAMGRLHQWYRQGTERDHAFRDGYNTATKSLFSLATRVARPTGSAQPRRGLTEGPTEAIRAHAPVNPSRPTGKARHRADDKRKMMNADTRKINVGDFRRSA